MLPMALDMSSAGHVAAPSADLPRRGVRRCVAQWCRRHQAWGRRLTVFCTVTLVAGALATVVTTGRDYWTDPVRSSGSFPAGFLETPASSAGSGASGGAGPAPGDTALASPRDPAWGARVVSRISQVPVAAVAVSWSRNGILPMPDMAVGVTWAAGGPAAGSQATTSGEAVPPPADQGLGPGYFLLVAATVLVTAATVIRWRTRHGDGGGDGYADATTIEGDGGGSASSPAGVVTEPDVPISGARVPDRAYPEGASGRPPAGTPDAGKDDDSALVGPVSHTVPQPEATVTGPTDVTGPGATRDVSHPVRVDGASQEGPPTVDTSSGEHPSPAPTADVASSAAQVVADAVPVETTMIIRRRRRTAQVR